MIAIFFHIMITVAVDQSEDQAILMIDQTQQIDNKPGDEPKGESYDEARDDQKI